MRLKKSPLSSASSIVQPEGTGSFRSVKQCAKIRLFADRDCKTSSLSTTRSDRFSFVAVENRVEIAFTLVVVLGAELDPLVMVGILLGWCYCIRGAQFSATDITKPLTRIAKDERIVLLTIRIITDKNILEQLLHRT